MGVVINILYAFLFAIITTITVYVVLSKIRDIEINIIHLVALGCVFIFMGIQSYLFFNAWDEKDALNEQTDAINSAIALASGYLDDVGLADEAKELSQQYHPVLDLLGITIDNSDNSIAISTDVLNSYYTKYMWKRVGWMFAAIAFYVLISLFLIPQNNTVSNNSRGDGPTLDTSDWQNY